MSVEEAKRFAEAVKGDAGLQAEVKGAGGTADGVASLAKSKGYDVTADDLKAHGDAAKGALSDADLDKVAGGMNTTAIVVVVAIAAT